MHGGKVAIQQVATDAFGNALGSSLAEAMTDSPTRVMGAERASDPENAAQGFRLTQAHVDGWGPRFNVADPLSRSSLDLYAGGTSRLSAYHGTYDDEVASSMSVEDRRPYVVGRPLPAMAPVARGALPEPSAVQYVYGRVVEAMDSIPENLDRLGEDRSTSSALRFAAAVVRNPATWIPGAVKGLAGGGGYLSDSQFRSQINTGVGDFFGNDPVGTTRAAATRYWDENSGLEIARDTFNFVAGGSIGAPLAKLPGLTLGETASLLGKAGETGLRWSQRLNDYSFDLVSVPSMRYQAGAIGVTVRNLRAEVTQMLPEGFELERISRSGAAVLRYGEDTYYSVPKSQYSVISELRTMDTMGDPLTRRVQTIADRFEPGLHLSDDQLLRLSLTRAVPEKSWLYDKFMSAYKGSYIHDVAGRELPFMKGAAGLEYKTVGPDIVPIGGGPGLRYEMTQLTPSLNAIFSHTKKYPDQLLRYVTYR